MADISSNPAVIKNKPIFSLYQAFFDKEYITSHPEDTEKITQLKDLMQEQVTQDPHFTCEMSNIFHLIFYLIRELHEISIAFSGKTWERKNRKF